MSIQLGTIIIADLEVHYCVGITETERSKPQRLLVSVEMQRDFKAAAASDTIDQTTDYFAVCQKLLTFGDDCHWQLIETLAVDIADMLAEEFAAKRITVEVKKFVIPQTRHVAVRYSRPEI